MIGDDDIKFLENYMGVTAEKPADHKAGGTLSLQAAKTTLKAGESVDIMLQGTNLKDVYAFGVRLPIDTESINVSAITTTAAEALEDAKATLADEDADAQTLDEAYRNLQAAINGLQEIVDSDKSALEQAISAAKDINTSLYTKETAEAFEQALKEAEAVMADETATQEQVDAAAAKLTAAQKALQKNPETPLNPQHPNEERPGQGSGSDTAAASAMPAATAMLITAAVAMLALRKRKNHI